MESQQQAAAPALWTSRARQHCVSRKLGERAFAGRTQHRVGHETKLRDLKVVKNVHRDAVLVTRLPFGCKVTASTGRMLREEDAGKLRAATSRETRRQAATDCGTKMKTVRSRSVSARPSVLRMPPLTRFRLMSCCQRCFWCHVIHTS